MDTTRASLLLRIRDRDDSHAWGEFIALYRPLLVRYARARGLDAATAEDVAQHCLTAIVSKIREFDYDPCRGRFRGWLKKMANDRVVNVIARRRERAAESALVKRPQAREPLPEETWEQIWLEEHLRHCCERIREQVEPRTYEAFQRSAIQQQPISEICAALGMNAGQVYVAKARVTRRLQDAMRELLGDDV